MKFIPQNQEWTYEQIPTANKNVQSFFMKGDSSHLVTEDKKFPFYYSNEAPVQIFLDENSIFLNEKIIDNEILLNSYFSIENLDQLNNIKDKLYIKIKKSLNELSINSGQYFVQLIFSDFMNRTTLLSIIDILINQIGFKGIMVLPVSLCLSVAKTTGSCCFIYKNGFSFMDDFLLVDSYVHNKEIVKNYNSLDSEDFAEEYSRLNLLDDSKRLSCRKCDHKEESEEKIRSHIEKEHKEGEFLKYEESEDFEESFRRRLNYLFADEKVIKLKQNIFSVGLSYSNSEEIEDYIQLAHKGASIFKELECGKEIWMTDEEWRSARLRILKEKVLFYF